MAQSTTLGDAEVDTLLKVEKADGSVKYFQVIKNQNVEISEEEYKERGEE